MGDMLSIGSNAANTFKRAIEVTSHNIANVNTEGYNRQRADIRSNAPNIVGTAFLGGGSKVEEVDRVYAKYIQNQLMDSYGLKERYTEQLSLSKQVEGIVASNDEGVQAFMQRLFDSFQNLANSPTSTTNRALVISESGNMESMLGNMSKVLQESHEQTNNEIKDLSDEINSRLQSIHLLNDQVQRASANGSQPPNDLLDQRDEAIKELSGFMDIKTAQQENGRIDISTGDGRFALLGDKTITKVEAQLTEFRNENRVEIYMQLGGDKVEVSDHIKGGQLGGVLDFRKNMLDRSMNELGLALNGLVASSNWQHYQGYDANGDPGQNFYTPLDVGTISSSKNTGAEDGTNIRISFTPVYNPNAPVQGTNPPYDPAAVAPAADAQPARFDTKQGFLEQAQTEIGRFEPREYELRFDAAANAFRVLDHQTSEPLKDNAGNPIVITRGAPDNGIENIEGLRFDVRAVAAGSLPDDGDKFIVKPHQEMMSSFKTEISSGEKLATRGQSPVDTTGSGTIDDEPPAAAAIGDNVNIANLASLQSKNLLYADESDNASETLLGGYSKMATNVGLYVKGTEIQLTAQTNVFEQISQRRESYSGVNLDEEAANLLKYQQSYQASAQIIQTSQTLFQTLISAVRI